MVKADPYDTLIETLKETPIGATDYPAFKEFLKLLVTPEEAEVASVMTMREFYTAEVIAEKAKKDVAKTRTILETLTKKGVVFRYEDRGFVLISPWFLYDLPFWHKTPDELKKEANLEKIAKFSLEAYTHGLVDEWFSTETSFGRVLPVEKSISHEVEVLPFEMVSEIVSRAKTIVLVTCPCRSRQEAAGTRKCDFPVENCFLFDSYAESFLERERGRKVSKEEALEIIRKSQNRGLVTTTTNAQDKSMYLCNCCGCCCTFLRGLTQFDKPRALAKSYYTAKVDPELCIGCGTCVKRCWFGAPQLVDDVSEIDPEKCMGCGICTITCPNKAISLTRTERPVTPRTIRDQLEMRVKEREMLKVN